MNKCLFCFKLTTNPKYCCKSCSAKHTNTIFPKRKTKKKCIVCKETVKSYKHTRCLKHQQEYLETRFDYLQELSLESYWNKKSLSSLHSSSKNVHIRALARTHFKFLLEKPCYNCGYSKHVELCHIKPISSFPKTAKVKEVNSINNLIQLCPNCHWEFDSGHLLLDFPDQVKSQ